MEVTNNGSSITPLDINELSSTALIDAFEHYYDSATANIRAVGELLGNGKKVRTLNTAVASLEFNLNRMKLVQETAVRRFRAQSQGCCGKQRSEIQAVVCVIGDWISGIVALGLSIKGLSDISQSNETVSVLKSVATFTLAVFQGVQGNLANNHLQQKAMERDLFLLLNSSGRRIQYVKSMIDSFRAWEIYQVHDGAAESASVGEFIKVIETLPIHPKGEDSISRHDLLSKFLNTRTGKKMLRENKLLQDYNRLIEQENGDQSSKIGVDSDVEHVSPDTVVHKAPRPSTSSMSNLVTDNQVIVNIPPSENLDSYRLEQLCWGARWDIDRLTRQLTVAYELGESEITSVGEAIQKLGENAIDFQAGILVLQEQIQQVSSIEAIVGKILNSTDRIPNIINIKDQQKYRSVIKVALTLFSFVTSTADTVMVYKKDSSNTTLEAVTFVCLIGAIVATFIDQRIRGNLIQSLNSQKQLRELIARKYSINLAAMVKVWTRYQTAIETGQTIDAKMALQTRIPRCLERRHPSMQIVGERLIADRKRREGTSSAAEACAAEDPFEDCIRRVVSEDKSPSKASDETNSSASTSSQQQNFAGWDTFSIDDEDELDLDWAIRWEKLEAERPRRRRHRHRDSGMVDIEGRSKDHSSSRASESETTL